MKHRPDEVEESFYPELLKIFREEGADRTESGYLGLVCATSGVGEAALFIADPTTAAVVANRAIGSWNQADILPRDLEIVIETRSPRQVLAGDPEPYVVSLFPVVFRDYCYGVLAVPRLRLTTKIASTLVSMSETFAQLSWLSRRGGEETRSLVHDVRGVLAGIHGYAMLLDSVRDGKEEDVEQICGIIRSELERVLIMTRDSLGGTNPRPPSLTDKELSNVSALAGSVARLFRARMQMAHITFYVDIQPDCQVACPPNILRRALENLLDNALKAVMSHSDPKVRIFVEKNNLTVRAGVEDSGPGFARLAQEAATPAGVTNNPSAGFGIGLTSVQRAADLARGSLLIEHTDRQTTRVFLALPVAQA